MKEHMMVATIECRIFVAEEAGCEVRDDSQAVKIGGTANPGDDGAVASFKSGCLREGP